jgi:hypothetical protein
MGVVLGFSLSLSLSHPKRRTKLGCIWEQNTEENVWAESGNNGDGDNYIKRSFINRTIQQALLGP